ncbi:MAG: BrnA antitoxin family protein [Acidisphaera sp.]|nr:BrnA antitoxin family protein [Acidisphaera sp.]
MIKKHSVGAVSWVDPDDAPELTEEHFARAEVRDGKRLVRRGRSKAMETKELVSLRLDRDVLEGWRETGPGWQTRINEALRKALR